MYIIIYRKFWTHWTKLLWNYVEFDLGFVNTCLYSVKFKNMWSFGIQIWLVRWIPNNSVSSLKYFVNWVSGLNADNESKKQLPSNVIIFPLIQLCKCKLGRFKALLKFFTTMKQSSFVSSSTPFRTIFEEKK